MARRKSDENMHIFLYNKKKFVFRSFILNWSCNWNNNFSIIFEDITQTIAERPT
jgi:hypothetical protein